MILTSGAPIRAYYVMSLDRAVHKERVQRCLICTVICYH